MSPPTTRARTEVRVAVLRGTARLEPWCAARGYEEALVGGFFVRPDGTPLGEIRTRGVARRHVPFDAPWSSVRACVHVQGGVTRIAGRDELPAEPRGDLLQAGPLLVRGGAPVFRREEDREGFSAGEAQFDSDITDGRYPRAALGLAPGRVFAVACDGRSRHDAGLDVGRAGRVDGGAGVLDGSEPGRRWVDVAGVWGAAAEPAAWGLGDARGWRAASVDGAGVPAALKLQH